MFPLFTAGVAGGNLPPLSTPAAPVAKFAAVLLILVLHLGLRTSPLI
jgi:hypothetical protein